MVDAVMMQRPSDPMFVRFCKDYQGHGGKVIVEVDDDLLNLHINNPAKGYYTKERADTHKELLRICDYIHCSTPELKESLRQEIKTFVFHNAIDLTNYTIPYRKECDIMWSGSETHKDSLDLIKPVIYQLLDMGKKVILMSKKAWLESMFRPHRNLTMLDFVPFMEYYKIPSMAKVFLTPLPHNRFNASKSELKVLEAAAWGVPSVSSDTAPYRRFNKASKGANVIVKEKFCEWMKAILSLLEDKDLYEEKSLLSLSAVKNIYNLELVNQERAKWWKQILQ